MGGIQGKPCGEVAQHVGSGFHIPPVAVLSLTSIFSRDILKIQKLFGNQKYSNKI